MASEKITAIIEMCIRDRFETVLQLLNPFAPHMTEELWEKLGHSHDEQLAYYPWPKYEEAKCVERCV